MTRSLQLARSTLLAVLVSSCATVAATPDAPPPPQRSPCEYYPLQVGNKWTYDVFQGGAASGASPEAMAVTITGTRGGFFLDDRNAQLACTVEGLRDDKRYLLRAPLDIGHKWSAVVGVGTTEQVEITGVGTTVVVPAGTFTETLTVQMTERIDANKTLIVEITFARHVGQIRFVTSVKEGGREIPQIEAQLRSYQSAPAAAPAGS